MEVRAVDFVVYDVSDMEKAITFYRDTLGLTLDFYLEGNWAEFSIENVTLALCGPKGGGTPPQRGYQGGAMVALAVRDMNAAVEELRSKGVHVEDPFDGSVCYVARMEDPDGNRLWLHQRKDGTAG